MGGVKRTFLFRPTFVAATRHIGMKLLHRTTPHIDSAIIACLLCALTCTAVRAQDTPQQQPSDSLNIDAMFRDLPEIMVKGERPAAKMEKGRLTYNMPLLLERLPADDAFQALGNIPGISIQQEAVTFAGQPVTLIIDGKVTTLSHEQVVERLKSMPADRLAKAEVMLSAPARYHVRGAVINIVTQDQGKEEHLAGQLQGAYDQNKYAGAQGKGNLLYVNGKLSVDADYAYRYGHSYAEAMNEAQHPLGDERVPYADHTTNDSRFSKHFYRAGLDYAFAENHSLSLAYTGSYTADRSHNQTTGSSVSQQNTQGHTSLHNADLAYNLPFGLQVTASYTRYESPQDQMLDGRLGDTERKLTASSNQLIDRWLVAADQTHALNRGWGISYGAKAQFSTQNSYQTTCTPDGQILPEATSSLHTEERIVNAYAGFSKQIGERISLDASVAAENYRTPQWNEWRIYPTLNALWRVNDRHLLNLSFSSDAQYPSYWSTMSGIYYSSVYTEAWGNPDLKPASNYNTSLMWQFDNRYTFVAFANLRPGFFVQLPYQPTDRMAVIMREVNFDHRNTYGLQAMAQFSAGTWLYGNAFLAGLYTHDRCDTFFDLPFNRRKLSAIAGGTASARLSRRTDLRFTLNPFFQSGAIQGVYDIKAMFTLNASLRWASADSRWNITLSGNNLTNRHFNTRSVWGNQHFVMNVCQDWVSGSLTLTWKFGNYRQKETRQVDTSRMGH